MFSVYEVYCASKEKRALNGVDVDEKIDISFTMPEQRMNSMMNKGVEEGVGLTEEGLESIVQEIAAINTEDSKCSKEEDEEKLKTRIREDENLNFRMVDKKVRKLLINWVADLCESQAQSQLKALSEDVGKTVIRKLEERYCQIEGNSVSQELVSFRRGCKRLEEQCQQQRLDHARALQRRLSSSGSHEAERLDQARALQRRLSASESHEAEHVEDCTWRETEETEETN